MSDHRIEVVPINLEPHPNADSLSLVRIFDAYVCCVRTEDWKGVDKAAYLPPDSVVPDTPEYAFLGGKLRIKAKKLRGIVSQGLLVPAPEGSNIGDDVADLLEIKHYEPESSEPLPILGRALRNPPIPGPIYDIESWFKYRRVFDDYPGVEVTITEKIHGMNSRFTYQDGKMWCGSHNFYRERSEGCIFWRTLDSNPWIEAYCRLNPNAVLYGEIFGYNIQKGMFYDCPVGSTPKFRMFDVFETGRFQDWSKEMIESRSDRVVPILYHGPYSHEVVEKFINGQSNIASHLKEGVVIRPVKELWNLRVGRVILKAVSPEYLEKKG